MTLTLAANEQLGIVANATTYTFTSSNSTFTTTSATDPANQATAFSAFGAASLTLNTPAQYSTINITDSAAGASVVFNNSGANAYSNNFTIGLHNGA